MLTFGHCQNWSISGIVRIGLRKTTIIWEYRIRIQEKDLVLEVPIVIRHFESPQVTTLYRTYRENRQLTNLRKNTCKYKQPLLE